VIDIAIEFIYKKNNLESIIFIFLIVFFFQNIKQGFISSLSLLIISQDFHYQHIIELQSIHSFSKQRD